MIRVALTLSAVTGLVDCGGDQSVAAFGAADTVWELQALDGDQFPAGTTLSFPETGKLSGDAPCNSYFGDQIAPYPWFKAERLASTKRACPELQQEQKFLQALAEMSLSEVAGNTLILSNDAGRELIFQAMK